MIVQTHINKLIIALKIKYGQQYFINQSQFYSEKLDKTCTKYTLHTGKPKEGEDFYSKMQLLEHLIFIYKRNEVEVDGRAKEHKPQTEEGST